MAAVIPGSHLSETGRTRDIRPKRDKQGATKSLRRTHRKATVGARRDLEIRIDPSHSSSAADFGANLLVQLGQSQKIYDADRANLTAREHREFFRRELFKWADKYGDLDTLNHLKKIIGGKAKQSGLDVQSLVKRLAQVFSDTHKPELVEVVETQSHTPGESYHTPINESEYQQSEEGPEWFMKERLAPGYRMLRSQSDVVGLYLKNKSRWATMTDNEVVHDAAYKKMTAAMQRMNHLIVDSKEGDAYAAHYANLLARDTFGPEKLAIFTKLFKEATEFDFEIYNEDSHLHVFSELARDNQAEAEKDATAFAPTYEQVTQNQTPQATPDNPNPTPITAEFQRNIDRFAATRNTFNKSFDRLLQKEQVYQAEAAKEAAIKAQENEKWNNAIDERANVIAEQAHQKQRDQARRDAEVYNRSQEKTGEALTQAAEKNAPPAETSTLSDDVEEETMPGRDTTTLTPAQLAQLRAIFTEQPIQTQHPRPVDIDAPAAIAKLPPAQRSPAQRVLVASGAGGGGRRPGGGGIPPGDGSGAPSAPVPAETRVPRGTGNPPPSASGPPRQPSLVSTGAGGGDPNPSPSANTLTDDDPFEGAIDTDWNAPRPAAFSTARRRVRPVAAGSPAPDPGNDGSNSQPTQQAAQNADPPMQAAIPFQPALPATAASVPVPSVPVNPTPHLKDGLALPGNIKYSVPPNPFEMERKQKRMLLPAHLDKKERINRLKSLIDGRGISPETGPSRRFGANTGFRSSLYRPQKDQEMGGRTETACIEYYRKQLAKELLEQEIESSSDQFAKDFRSFLTPARTIAGQKKANGAFQRGMDLSALSHAGFGFGAPPPHDPSVAAYLDKFVDKKAKFERELRSLILRGPKTLDEQFYFYKYVVRGVAAGPEEYDQFLDAVSIKSTVGFR